MLDKILGIIWQYQISKFIKKAVEISDIGPPGWSGGGFPGPEGDNPFDFSKRFSYPLPNISSNEVATSPLDIENEPVLGSNEEKQRISESASLLAKYFTRRSLDVPIPAPVYFLPQPPLSERLGPMPELKKPEDYTRYGFPTGILIHSMDLQGVDFPLFRFDKLKDWIPNIVRDFFKLELDHSRAEYFIHKLKTEIDSTREAIERSAYGWARTASISSGLGEPNTIQMNIVGPIPPTDVVTLYDFYPVTTASNIDLINQYNYLSTISDILNARLHNHPEKPIPTHLVLASWFDVDEDTLWQLTQLRHLSPEQRKQLYNKVINSLTIVPISGGEYSFTEAFWFDKIVKRKTTENIGFGFVTRNVEYNIAANVGFDFSIRLQPEKFSFFFGPSIEPLPSSASLYLAHPDNKPRDYFHNLKPDLRHLLLLKLTNNYGEKVSLFYHLAEKLLPIIDEETKSFFQKFRPIIEDERFVKKLSAYTQFLSEYAATPLVGARGRIQDSIERKQDWSDYFKDCLHSIIGGILFRSRNVFEEEESIKVVFENMIDSVLHKGYIRDPKVRQKIMQNQEEFAGRLARLFNYLEIYEKLQNAHNSIIELATPVEERNNKDINYHIERVISALPFIEMNVRKSKNISHLEAPRPPTVRELAFLSIGAARLQERYGHETFYDIQQRILNFRSEFEKGMISDMNSLIGSLEEKYMENLRRMSFQDKAVSLSKSLSNLHHLSASIEHNKFALRARISRGIRRR